LTHRVLVYGARVHVLVIDGSLLGSTRSLLFGRGALSVDLNVGEGKEEILTLGVFKVTLGLVPGSTFKPESMDPASFSGLSDSLAFNASIISNNGVARISDLSSRLDSIQSPIVSSMGTGDLLIDGCEETLGIEESSQPERDGSVLSQPVGESEVSVLERSEPSRQGRGEPGDFCSGGIK